MAKKKVSAMDLPGDAIVESQTAESVATMETREEGVEPFGLIDPLTPPVDFAEATVDSAAVTKAPVAPIAVGRKGVPECWDVHRRRPDKAQGKEAPVVKRARPVSRTPASWDVQ